jgi:hypothetical protein
VLCAGSTLPLAKQSLDEAPYKLSGAVAKLAGITFWSIGFFLDTIKLWFLTEGKFATVLIYLPLGVPNWMVICPHHPTLACLIFIDVVVFKEYGVPMN